MIGSCPCTAPSDVTVMKALLTVSANQESSEAAAAIFDNFMQGCKCDQEGQAQAGGSCAPQGS